MPSASPPESGNSPIRLAELMAALSIATDLGMGQPLTSLDNSNGNATLSNSTLSGNSASKGGGIDNNRGTFTMTSSRLNGNSAIYYADGVPWLYLPLILH